MRTMTRGLTAVLFTASASSGCVLGLQPQPGVQNSERPGLPQEMQTPTPTPVPTPTSTPRPLLKKVKGLAIKFSGSNSSSMEGSLYSPNLDLFTGEFKDSESYGQVRFGYKYNMYLRGNDRSYAYIEARKSIAVPIKLEGVNARDLPLDILLVAPKDGWQGEDSGGGVIFSNAEGSSHFFNFAYQSREEVYYGKIRLSTYSMANVLSPAITVDYELQTKNGVTSLADN